MSDLRPGQATRRAFCRLALGSAAGALLAGPVAALAAPAGGPPTVRPRACPTSDKLFAPTAPLVLPPWRYGRDSAAPDTVLMFRGNPSHTFYGTGPLPERLRPLWTTQLGAFESMLRGQKVVWAGTGWTGQPVKLGDTVFVGAVDTHLYAIEAATGAVRWRLQAGRMFKSSPCIYENRLYIGNVDDQLRCVDPATGQTLWCFNTQHDLDSSPCVHDDRLYICGESGFARCHDPRTGALIWEVFLGGVGRDTLPGSNGVETSPAVADGELYAASFDGVLFCVDAQTGQIRWKVKTGDDTDVSPVIAGDRVFIAAEDANPVLFCFSRSDRGRIVWQHRASRGFWSTPAVVGERVYAGGSDGHMRCFDAATGRQIWDYSVGKAIWSSPAVVDGKVVFGSYDPHLYLLAADTGALLCQVKVPGRIISTPCVVDGRVYVGTATGAFFCFGA